MRFAIAFIVLLIVACSSPAPETITVVVTATPEPTIAPTSTPVPTPIPAPPNTPSPAPTSQPAPTSTPAPKSPIERYSCTNLIHKGKFSAPPVETPLITFPLLEVEIVTIYNIKELSKTFTLLECEGEAALRIENQFDRFYRITYSIGVDSEGELSVNYRFE